MQQDRSQKPVDEVFPVSLAGSMVVQDVAKALKVLLADVFVLYIKTKSFHWHMTGPHFRDFHLMLDEQAEQIFATTDALAERARKRGFATLRSIGEIAQLQRIVDNDATDVSPLGMLIELCGDNAQLARSLLATRALCEERDDVATASLIETWIDEAEGRRWFLHECAQRF